MSNKDTTDVDKYLESTIANIWMDGEKFATKVIKHKSPDMNYPDYRQKEFYEALLLWRDTEVIKTLKKIKKNYGDKFLSPNNKNNVAIIDFDDINAWITQLQSNLKEREV